MSNLKKPARNSQGDVLELAPLRNSNSKKKYIHEIN